MAHTIVNLDNLKAVQAGLVYSGRFYSTASTPVATAIDNGRPVMLNGLLTGERELFHLKAPVDVTADKIFITTTPEVMYRIDETGLENFYNAAGEEVRLHAPEVGDFFQVTTDAIGSGTEAVGKFLIPSNGATTWTVSDTIGSTRFSAEIIALTKLGYNKISAVRVLVRKA